MSTARRDVLPLLLLVLNSLAGERHATKPARRRLRGERNQLAARKREELLDAIRRMPGLSIARLQAEAGISGRGHIIYCLRVLLKEKLVFTRECGRQTLIFPVGTREDAVLDAIKSHLLEAKNAMLIYEGVCQRPGIWRHELKAQLGLSHGLFYHHLNRLIRAGLIEVRSGDPKARAYRRLYAIGANEATQERG